MFIKKTEISPSVKDRMCKKAGFREKEIMKNATHVFTCEKGRCIKLLDSKTGKTAQFDLHTGYWTN